MKKCRLESLNEKRSGVIQMVKLAEKERDNLEVCAVVLILSLFILIFFYVMEK